MRGLMIKTFYLLCAFMICAGLPMTAAQEKDIDKRLSAIEKRLDKIDDANMEILRLLQGGKKETLVYESTELGAEKPTAISVSLVNGWVARIYDFPIGFDATSGLPKFEHGFFNATKSAYKAHEIQQILETPITSGIFWNCEGVLNVPQAGAYTFTMNINPTCGGNTRAWCAVLINGKVIVSRYGSCSSFTMTGGAELDVGVHRVEFRFAPGIDDKMRSRGGYDNGAGFSLFIKIPGENKPRPAHEILLRKNDE